MSTLLTPNLFIQQVSDVILFLDPHLLVRQVVCADSELVSRHDGRSGCEVEAVESL